MTETTRASSATYYPALDGLRGAGIVAMLLYHANLGLASGAFLAISMFFTLSGYLIGGQLHAEFERSKSIDFKAFYERRVRRLMPAAVLGLLGAMLYTLWFARPGEIGRVAGDILAALLYVPNWRFVATGQNYDAIFSNPSPVQHYWSLGVEEQFYMGLPLLFWYVLSRGSTRKLFIVTFAIALASACVMAWVRVPGAPLGHAYYGTDTRLAEVLIGVLLALWFRNGFPLKHPRAGDWVNGLAVVVLGASFVLWWTASETQLWFYRGGALVYALGTAITIAACIRKGPVQRLLGIEALAYVGRISYGLYVYHWPIYLSLDAVNPGWPAITMLALKVGVTFAVAAASHRWIELPIRHRRWFLGPRRAFVPPALLGLMCGAALALRVTAPAPVANEEVRIEAATAAALPTDREASLAGEARSRPRVLVMGDSMAEGIGKGLVAWGVTTGAAEFGLHSIPACGLGLDGERRLQDPVADMTAPMCRIAQRHWKDGLVLSRYDAIVLLIGTMDLLDRRLEGWDDFRSPGDPAFDRWLVSVYGGVSDLLLSQGVEVVFLTYPCSGSTQYIEEHKIMRRTTGLVAAAAFDIERIRYFNDTLLPRVKARRPEEIHLVDLFDQVCPGGNFTPGFASYAEARLDGIHFREESGREIADWLGPAILQAIGRSVPQGLDVSSR